MEERGLSMKDEELIRSRLWNSEVTVGNYDGPAEKYHGAIFEQYKLYVNMADRVSNRRGITNTFFLTLNTGIFSVIGALWSGRSTISTWFLLLFLIVLIGECTAWWWLVRSYRLLNSAKFKVIGVLEERLPASIYSRAEWAALGEGKDWHKYLPLTHLEQWIPVFFGLVYLAGSFLMINKQ
jgi:hypothetical protein